LVTAALLFGATARAEEEPARDPHRNTERIAVGAAAAVTAAYPQSIADPGPALVVDRPLWLGKRHRAFQWVLEVEGLGQYGVWTRQVHLALGPRYGFDLLLGSVYGMEFRLGADALLQAGDRTAPGLSIMSFSWAHSFRLAKGDDDRRIKLSTFMDAGVYFAHERHNDMGFNAAMMGIALAYQTPY